MNYSDEELLDALREFASEAGESPTSTAVRDASDMPSVQTYRRRFETWNGALDAAGLDSGGYEKADLIEKIQPLANDLGHVPTVEDVNAAESCPHVWTFQDRFGTWNNAVEAAGLDPNPGSPLESPSNHELAQALVELTEQLGRAPIKSEMEAQGTFGATIYRDRFGEWDDALAAAGIERRGKRPEYTRKRLIRDLQDYANYGQRGTTTSPDRRQMDADGPHSAAVYVDAFGSWPAALVAAGLSPQYRLSRAAIIEEIQAVAETLGREPYQGDVAPTVEEMREYGDISTAPAIHRFGSWNEAVAEAGFVPNETFRDEYAETYEAEELLDAIHEVAADTDRAPRASEVAEATGVNPDTFRRRFGSWHRALQLAGISPERASPGGVAYGTEPALSEYAVGGPEELTLETEIGGLRLRRGDRIIDSYSPLSPYLILGFELDEEHAPPEWTVITTPLDHEMPQQRPFYADFVREQVEAPSSRARQFLVRAGEERDRDVLEAAADWSAFDEAIVEKRHSGVNETSAEYMVALERVDKQTTDGVTPERFDEQSTVTTAATITEWFGNGSWRDALTVVDVEPPAGGHGANQLH